MSNSVCLQLLFSTFAHVVNGDLDLWPFNPRSVHLRCNSDKRLEKIHQCTPAIDI